MSYLEELKERYKAARKRMEKHAIREPRVISLPPPMRKPEPEAHLVKRAGLLSEKEEKEIVCKALKLTSIDNLPPHSQAFRLVDELMNSPRLPPLPGLSLDEPGGIRWMRVMHAVAKSHGISPADIMGESRMRHIVNARFEVFYRLRIDLAMSYTRIATIFSKDHSTIIHGVRKLRSKLLDEAKKAEQNDCPPLVKSTCQSGDTPDNLSAA